MSEHTTESENKEYPLIPVIPRLNGIDRRKSQRPYIPHPTPPNSDRLDWHNAYLPQLKVMYCLVSEIIDKRYPKLTIKWDDADKFHNFSRLIYHCSSKHISPYLEEDENEFKEMGVIY
jgi:hypothetical protein